MGRMDDSFVDLVVTSPPYDNLRDYKGYFFDFQPVAQSLYRVMKDGGVVVWVVADATINGSETGTSFKQALYFMEVGFKLHDTMIYRCRKPPLTHKRYEQEFEYMFVFVKGEIKTFNGITQDRLWKDNRGSKKIRREANGNFDTGFSGVSPHVLMGNVWNMESGGGHSTRLDSDIAYQHPAIFSEKLAEMHIISWSNEGDLVYDPFLGSGTTAKMALLYGRNYVGSEVSLDYCKIAQERILRYVR